MKRKKFVLSVLLTTLLFTAENKVADSSYYLPSQKEIIEAEPERITQVCNVSAYSASVRECGKADGITASGTIATEGRTIAADHLPFGTVVIINGHSYVVEDRFGGGYKDRIDIYHDSEDAAWDFGRRQIEVEIVEAKI